ncbi:MAG: hypothetical protein RJA57_1933 [Bacteroidota bacterium]
MSRVHDILNPDRNPDRYPAFLQFSGVRYLLLFFSVLLCAVHALRAQESSEGLSGWEVSSSKAKADGEYDIRFRIPALGGWQLYAPEQELSGVKTTEVLFPDSSVMQVGPFRQGAGVLTLASRIFEGQSVRVFGSAAEFSVRVRIRGDVPATLQGTLLYTYGREDSLWFFPSIAFEFSVPLADGVRANGIRIPAIDLARPVSDCGDEGTRDKGLLSIFLLGFLGGLIALLTPCVFPMIPVTVTFFTKRSTDRRQGVYQAVLYGFFIFLIYLLITVPFHIAGKAVSPEIFNNISTSVWLNLFFFAIFVVFALSFFGLFEIGLPPGLANRMDARSGLGNLGGIFFMAATLAIVSFSCTGPILGTLLVGVAEQGAWPLTVGAAGFGLALGLPFALFALFPHWLHSLPKSGGWMTDVKVVLGFVELALAVKFLSNADLVKQWGLLKREVFIGIWVLIGILIVLYLTGRLRIGHASPVKKFTVTRISFIALFSLTTLYLIPGLTNTRAADLKWISGFPPPRTYSIYSMQSGRSGVFSPLHNDYEQALRLAQTQNKPLLIDFTGWACVNCRRMEENVWTDPVVDSFFRTRFIVVSLYVDERKNLPLTERRVEKLSNGTEKSIVTVGNKWSTFQFENFGATSQPQYAILGPDQRALTRTKFYTASAEEFVQWLECGLDAFGKTYGTKPVP